MSRLSLAEAVRGISTEEAAKKLKENGPNEIQQEKSRPLWRLLLEQFQSPLVLILIFACLLSVVLGEHVEALAIGAILVINALIGFFQEYRAENAIAALQEMTAPRARVLRDGKQTTVLARDIVVSDVLLLEAGDIVSADAEIVEASHFQVNEAVLTGESLPVAKGINSDLKHIYMGTSVVTGTATAVVSATGMKTELGKIAHLISTAQSGPTPLQQQLAKVGRTLLYICFSIVGLIAIVGILQGYSWLSVLLFSVSLAVAAVPEGLPAIVTVALALGVQRMAARNALVKKLPCVETLGSVSVICTDKTGTLTTGQMRLRETHAPDKKDLLLAAASCCDAELDTRGKSDTGDPTEIAILIAAQELGIFKEEIETANPRVSSQPFDSDRRRMSIYRSDNRNYVKGAVESILPLCQENTDTSLALAAAEEMSSRGLRVLAVAVGTSPEEENLQYVGLLGLADPPRPEVLLALQEAREAGISSIMITGDHPQTARAIAKELGLVREGEDVEALVYARATPEEKLKLVRHWKNQGAIVAMTGDGVNDAPALREAHIGVAMGKAGTEVTRQAADLILADDNFATIVSAVREGRRIFQNIRKAVVYLLTGNFAEVMLVLGAVLLGLPLPLLAAHLLWINLVTDALPALTLVLESLAEGTMRQPPRDLNEPILGRREWLRIATVGLLEAVLALGLYGYLLPANGENYARAMVFTFIVFSQLFRAFAARSFTKVFWELGALSNAWLLGVVILTGVLQVLLYSVPLAQTVFVLKPLTWVDLQMLLPLSLIPVTLVEVSKLLTRWVSKEAS